MDGFSTVTIATSPTAASYEPIVLGAAAVLLLLVIVVKVVQSRAAKRRRAASSAYYDKDMARYGRGIDDRTSSKASSDRVATPGAIPYGSTQWQVLREPAPITPLPMPVLSNVIDQSTTKGMPAFDAAGAFALRTSQQQIEMDIQAAKLEQVAPRQGPKSIPVLTEPLPTASPMTGQPPSEPPPPPPPPPPAGLPTMPGLATLPTRPVEPSPSAPSGAPSPPTPLIGAPTGVANLGALPPVPTVPPPGAAAPISGAATTAPPPVSPPPPPVPPAASIAAPESLEPVAQREPTEGAGRHGTPGPEAVSTDVAPAPVPLPPPPPPA